jgi:hypothetical protein
MFIQHAHFLFIFLGLFQYFHAKFLFITVKRMIFQAVSCYQFPNILWYPELHYCVRWNPPLVPILSQINPVYITPSYLSTISVLSTDLLLVFLAIYIHLTYALPISFSLIWSFQLWLVNSISNEASHYAVSSNYLRKKLNALSNYVSQSSWWFPNYFSRLVLSTKKHTTSHLPSEILTLCWTHHLQKKITSDVESISDKMQASRFYTGWP